MNSIAVSSSCFLMIAMLNILEHFPSPIGYLALEIHLFTDRFIHISIVFWDFFLRLIIQIRIGILVFFGLLLLWLGNYILSVKITLLPKSCCNWLDFIFLSVVVCPLQTAFISCHFGHFPKLSSLVLRINIGFWTFLILIKIYNVIIIFKWVWRVMQPRRIRTFHMFLIILYVSFNSFVQLRFWLRERGFALF